MTNEQLVWKIKAGHSELIPQLWEGVVKFIDMKAGIYLDSFPDHYRALRDDMVNQSYFYFLKAIQGYEERGNKFTTYLDYHLKNAFTEVIIGRSSRLKNEPLNQSISLDKVITGTEITLAETLIDETSEAYYRRIEDIDFWNSVNEFLNQAIDRVSNERGRNIVRYMLDNGCAMGVAIKALYGVTSATDRNMYDLSKRLYDEAMRQIGHYMKFSTIKKQLKSIGLDDYIYGYGTGIKSFKRHSFTSSVELAAMRKVDGDNFRRDILEVIM